MAQVASVSSVSDEQLSLFDIGVDVSKLREERTALLSWTRSVGTQKGYCRDFKIFTAWCETAGRDSLPATSDTLELFITAQVSEGFKVSTIERRVAAIAFTHKSQGLPNPNNSNCRELLAATRRRRREKKEGKRALGARELLKISLRLGQSNIGLRDRALLVFGFASGMRRSELTRLTLGDIVVTHKGVAINVEWSKTDQEGRGRTFAIFAGEKANTDPVRTMRAWLAVRGNKPGHLFTRVKANGEVTLNGICDLHVGRIVHRAVKRIGLDPQFYGAHSLRAGLVTAAADNGATDQEIMRASGHKTQKVMQQYIRHSRVFADRNPLAGVL